MAKAAFNLATPIAMALCAAPALASTAPFLNFPVRGYTPYSYRLITTVLDHDVSHDLNQTALPFKKASVVGPYGYSGAVLSFTGEFFLATPKYPTSNLACYPKPTNKYQRSIWSLTLTEVYDGTKGCAVNDALNYDNHPGYDYKTPSGSFVYPASGGAIISSKCIATFYDGSSCEAYGAVAVDHGNGFVTQYLHMVNVNYGAAARGVTQSVKTDWVLGKVSNTGVPTAGAHLHFEVLQRKARAVDNKNYYARANYMVVDPYGYNNASSYADNLQSKPGCLWLTGCHF